jgi:hypothetical protein
MLYLDLDVYMRKCSGVHEFLMFISLIHSLQLKELHLVSGQVMQLLALGLRSA